MKVEVEITVWKFVKELPLKSIRIILHNYAGWKIHNLVSEIEKLVVMSIFCILVEPNHIYYNLSGP